MRRFGRSALGLVAALALLPAPGASAAEGDLVNAFGGDARETFDWGNDDVAHAAVVQPDGKLVVAGTWDGGSADFAIARYNPDGTLDPTFSGDGRQNATFGAGAFGGVESAHGVALQQDGKIVVVGSTDVGGTPTNFGVLRLTADGELDPAFSGDGKQVIENFPVDAVAEAVAIQPDGKIVVGGWFEAGGAGNFAFARLTPEGELDAPAFDGDGMRDISLGGHEVLKGLALQPDGKIVGVGYTNVNSGTTGPQDFAIARLTSGGVRDDTGPGAFSGDGQTTVDFNSDDERAEAVVIAPDGRIVVGGTWNFPGNANFAFAALEPDGDLDLGFHNDGRRDATFDGTSQDSLTSLVQQPDGKLLAAGRSDADAGPDQMALLRLTPAGFDDNAFSGNARQRVDFAGADDEANGVALGADRVYAVGSTGPAAARDFAIAALEYAGPQFAVQDATTSEGDAGAVTVQLSGPARTLPVSVAYATSDGTASAGSDYVASSGTLTFAPGETQKTIAVPILGDGAVEPAETALVRLSGQSAGTGIADAEGTLTIADDDRPPVVPPLPPPLPPPVPNVAPAITGLSIVPSSFRARTGARILFTLSELARVRFTFLRAVPGRRAAGRCVAPSRRNRRARRCTRFVRFAVVTRRNVAAGPNSFRIGERVGGRRLRPGRYRLHLRADDAAGALSRIVRAGFRVRRPR